MSTSSSRAVSMMIGTWLRSAGAGRPRCRRCGASSRRGRRDRSGSRRTDRVPRDRRGRRRPRTPLCAAGTREGSGSTPRRRRAGCEPKPQPWREVSFSGAPMFDPRIYRAALIPAVVAFVVLMFSFEPIPNPLPEPVSTPTFDGAEAAQDRPLDRATRARAQPGSAGDDAVADLVRERFGAIEGGEVADQSFDSSYDGEDVTMRNVILTLPGSSERTILVLAHRDSAEGPGAATSAAATATLLGLADDLGRPRRTKTMIFASTDGGSDGAEGARELIEDLPAPSAIDEAIAISQPGVEDPEAPFVISSGTDPESASAQLAADRPQRSPPPRSASATRRPGAWLGLSRLAFPAGAGEQLAIRRAGTEADRDQRPRRAPDPAGPGRSRRRLLRHPGGGRQHADRSDRDPRREPEARRGARRLHPRRRQPRPRLDDRAARDLAADRPDPDRRRHLAPRAPQRLADAADDPLGDRAGAAPARRAAARLPARPRRPRPRSALPLRPGALPPGLGRADRVRRPARRPSCSPPCSSGRCGRRSTSSRRRSPPPRG